MIPARANSALTGITTHKRVKLSVLPVIINHAAIHLLVSSVLKKFRGI